MFKPSEFGIKTIQYPLISTPSPEYPSGYGARIIFNGLDDVHKVFNEPEYFKPFIEKVGVAIATVFQKPLALTSNSLPQTSFDPAPLPFYNLPWHVDVAQGTPELLHTSHWPSTWGRGGFQILWQDPTSIGRYSSTLCCPTTQVCSSLIGLCQESPEKWLEKAIIPSTRLSIAKRVAQVFQTENRHELSPTAQVMSIRDRLIHQIDSYGENDPVARILEAISVYSIKDLLQSRKAMCMDWFRYNRGVMFIWDGGQKRDNELPLCHTRWNRKSPSMGHGTIHAVSAR